MKSKPKVRTLLNKKLWKFQLSTWLVIVGVFLLVAGILAFFLVRRQVIEYRMGHTFSVGDPAFFGTAHALADPLPIGGNKIELLQNGDQIFGAMLKAIREAKKSVNFEAYILHSGKVGSEFMEAFKERARAGVQVRVMLDGIGSGRKLNNSEVSDLKKSGCHFAYFHPTRSLRFDRANRRSHRRVMVVDGRIGFTGGVGFADEWAGNADSPDHWRDVHARIEGPLVAKLQGAFQQHWAAETGEALTGEAEFPKLSPAGDLQGQLIASHDYSLASLSLVQAVTIAATEKTLFITNPYFTPSDSQEKALIDAAKRGVDVRLLVPGEHNDQPISKSAGRSSYGEILKAGVKIYEYEPTMIHAKTMVADGKFSVLGTSNLDARSSQINEEIDISVYDERFAAEMERVFKADLEHARLYPYSEFTKRGLWERFTEWIAIPFRSQM